MKKVIMVKYAELTTKKDNRSFFINTLDNNIKSALSKYEPIIEKDYYRMFISVKEEYIAEVILILTKVFGILEVETCIFSEDSSIENICDISKSILSENVTFKVETNRSDKSYPINSCLLYTSDAADD